MTERIVLLINSLTGGGAERVMAAVASFLGETVDGYEIHLVLIDAEPQRYEVSDRVVIHAPPPTLTYLGRIVRAFFLLRRLRPRTTISFLTRSNLINVAASISSGRPCIVSERTNTSAHHGSGRGAIRPLLLGTAYRAANLVVAVSKDVARDLHATLGVQESKILVVNNPVDDGRLGQAAAEAPSIGLPKRFLLAVGRLVPSKRFDILLRGYAASNSKASLVILGSGPLEGELKALSTSLNVSDSVFFAGFLSNPHAVMSKAVGYIQSSEAEGFPNTLVEAMTLGLPVAATDCRSGPSEILDDAVPGELTTLREAKYGILVPVNSVEHIGLAMALLDDDSTREARVRRSLDGAARYVGQHALIAYRDAILQIASEQPVRAF